MKSLFPRRAASLFLALVLAFSLAVPALADDPENPEEPPKVVSFIELNHTTLSMKVGAADQKLEVSWEPADAVPPVISWSSDDEKIATVSNDGTVHAVGEGITKIIASSPSLSPAECEVTVAAADPTPPKPTVTSVSIEPKTLELTMVTSPIGDLKAIITPDTAASANPVTWSTSASSIATVDGNGRVTARGAGTATVYASAGDKIGTCTVKVNPAPSITLDHTSLDLTVTGGAQKVKATYSNSITNVIWFISDTSVATLEGSANGSEVSVRGLKAGITTLTIRDVNNAALSASCIIRVTAPDPGKVTAVTLIEPASPYLDPGGTVDLKAIISPNTATAALSWSSSSNAVATVDSTGRVKGVAPGTVKITVSAPGGFSDSIDLEVSGVTLEKHTLSLFINKSETLVYHLYGSVKTSLPEWHAVNPSIADASPAGRVTGHLSGSTDVTITVGKYKDSCTVTVSEDLAQAIERDLGTAGSYSFAGLLSDLNDRCNTKTKAPLDYVYGLEVSTGQGTLLYGFTSPDTPGHGVGGSERYYYQNTGNGKMPLRDITFVPKNNFVGTAVIDYTGVGTNGVTFIGTIRITVASTGDVTYSTAADRPVTFSAGDFSAICLSKTGKGINYVTFDQPAASRGTLYYNYSPTGQYSQKVDGNTRYYASSNPNLSLVTFVPAEGFVGTVDVTYRCTDSSGSTYAGRVTITVYAPSGSGTGDVEYSTGMNQRFSLNATDFNDVSRRITSTALDYIRFDSLPSTSNGILYYNYTSSSSTRVTTSTSYYRNSSPRIANITFVPARDYRGTVTIPFTGRNTSGNTFTANLVIRVDDETGTVTYSTPANQPVTFNATDFNTACQRANGTALNRVSFTLPASGSGTLYYNYISSTSSGSRVASNESYYRSGNPSLSGVTFVPASNYNGTVTIPFSGYDANGGRFSGTVVITVGRGYSTQVIRYNAVTGGFVRFDAADFNDASRAVTGDPLNYVRFDIPSSRNGTLYYQYNTSSRTGTSVNSTTSYYRSGGTRSLGDVYFVPSSTAGVTTLHYTGYTTRSETYTGTVEITVSAPVVTTVRYSGSAAPIYFRASDFQTACQGALGTALSYIRFTSLPSSGGLYTGYANPVSRGTSVATGTSYYANDINQIVYLPKAETQMTLTIPYTGYDASGASYNSTVEITLSNSYASCPFTDVAYGWDWAKPSIEFLRQSGITTGYSNNTFGPGRQISRAEFTLMVCRAFQFQTGGSAASFPDVPAGSVYAGAIATARNLGIVQGDGGLFKPNNPITRQSAMTMICRAIEASGQSLPAASSTLLSAFADGDRVSSFARYAVAALVQMGAVRGTTDMRINPTAAISRAEMAVILHRVLTR